MQHAHRCYKFSNNVCTAPTSAYYVLNSSSYSNSEQKYICDLKKNSEDSSTPCYLWPCSNSYLTESVNRGDCSNSPVPKSWAFLGFRVRDGIQGETFALKPTVSPALFRKITPRPMFTISLNEETLINGVRLRQRNMAWGDATLSQVLIRMGDVTSLATFGPPTADCSSGTCLTDLSKDAYGRDGIGAPVVLEFTEKRVTSISFEMDSVHAYEPPLEYRNGIDANHTAWSISKLQSDHNGWYQYAHVTNGTMNLGFTEITFLYNNVPISEASLGDVDTTVTAYGTAFTTLGTPFRYAYVTPSERYTRGTASTAILKSSVWMGHDVVNGINRDYGLTDLRTSSIGDRRKRRNTGTTVNTHTRRNARSHHPRNISTVGGGYPPARSHAHEPIQSCTGTACFGMEARTKK